MKKKKKNPNQEKNDAKLKNQEQKEKSKKYYIFRYSLLNNHLNLLLFFKLNIN